MKIACLFVTGWKSFKSPCCRYMAQPAIWPDAIKYQNKNRENSPFHALIYRHHRLKIQLCISAEWRSEGRKEKGILYLLVHRKVSDCLEENKEFHGENRLPDSSPERNISCFFSFVVTSQLPGNASFQVWMPSAAHLASWAKSALDGARTPSGNV